MKSKIYENHATGTKLSDMQITIRVKYILVFLALVCGIHAHSQATMNLSIFSDDGELFYVFVNGVKRNSTPEANVKLMNQSTTISVKIEFENKILPSIKQNMSLDAGQEHLAKIIRNKKNQLKLRYYGSTPINETQNSSTTNYNTAEDAVNETYSSTPVYTVSQGTATTSQNNYQNGSGKTTYSVYTTTSSTNKYAMNESSFLKMKESVESKSFSDTKMSTAQIALKNNYLSVNQIKVIAALFSMDEDRLTYAKYAYDYCVDKANYYQVGDVFKFSLTVDELNSFLQKGSR